MWAFFKTNEGFVKSLLSFAKMPENNLNEITSVPENLEKYNFSCYF